MNEEWKAVNGFEGIYEVSNWGRVRRLSQASDRVKCIHPRRNYDPKIIRLVINNGYGYVTLMRGERRIRKGIHALVLETFVGLRPDGYYACHRDGNKSNNMIANLKWATPKENQQDRVIHGHGQDGENNGSSKLTQQDVRQIRKIRSTQRLPYYQIAEMFGCTKGNVHLICTGQIWASVV